MNRLIVFNALQTSLSGGIGRYSYELGKELYIQNPNNIKIVIRKEDLNKFKFVKIDDLIIAEGIKNSKQRNIYEQFKLPHMVYKRYPDAILHYPDSMAPIFSKNEVIITVHDIAFKSLKKVFTWKSFLWKNFITKVSLKKASKIIAITEFTKNEILKYYNVDNKKINVVYNGFNDFSNEKIEFNKVRENIKSIKKDYILTVSTISPRKNIDGLIRSFNNIKNKVNCKLVIVGAKGWLYEDVFKLIEELKLEEQVIFTDKVNDDELKWLYKGARLFTYLSFYEGFGLPPLEAMSFGIPCIVSDSSSLPEVVGNAAIRVDPYNIEKIQEEIIRGLGEQIIERKVMVENIRKFSWEICAEKSKMIYSEMKQEY